MTPEEAADRMEIGDLFVAYARALDTRDWEGLGTVLTDDPVLDYSAFDGPRAGVAEVVPWLQANLGAFALSQHFVGNVQVWFDGPDAARARCEIINPMLNPREGGGLGGFLVGGSYDDRLVRTAAGWRIAERVASPSWLVEL